MITALCSANVEEEKPRMWKPLIKTFALAACVLGATAALAHEGREIDGYELHFGWQSEPAYAGQINGPEVFIHVHGDHEESEAEEEEAPFPEDIAVELQVEVSFGDQEVTLPLRPAFGETGHYLTEMIPALPGDYSFRLFGTIGDTAVNETFSSAEGAFSTVEPVSDIVFPVVETETETQLAELQTMIDELRFRIDALENAQTQP
jgi:hypothetical protein